MENLIRCAWWRYSGTFWASLVLSLTALFSLSTPTLAARSRYASAEHQETTNTVANHNSRGRWIEVDLSRQRLIAWDGGRRVYSTLVSTGKRTTPTPTGSYAIQSKERSAHMRGKNYNIPDVPNTMYFAGGYAIHGAYWHNRFGTPITHGCINVPVSQSRRLFSWADEGTRVVVHS